MLSISAAPLTALVLAALDLGSAYMFVFVLVGLTPVTIRTLNNYTLEICEPADHPKYLSTLSLCVALPIFLAPLAGLLVDAVGFNLVFLAVAVLLVISWLLTFTLSEPRHHHILGSEGGLPGGTPD